VRPRQWAAAVGLPTTMIVWCIGWLLWDLLAAGYSGWLKLLFGAWFVALLAWNVWQWPRSLRSYRRLLESGRRANMARARLMTSLLVQGYPPSVVYRVDELVMTDAPVEQVQALLDEHRPA
jgi:hypothetical protein